jgi:uncharacterized membrane protein
MRLGGHPLHPLLVHFPIAFWTAGVACDLAAWIHPHSLLWMAAYGCHALGSLTAVVAMLAGFLALADIPREHPAERTASAHMLCMCAAWIAFVTSLVLRGLSPSAPVAHGVIAVGLVGWVTMAYGASLGGALVYRFGIAVGKL